jgi:hypothetical protein
MSNTDLLPRRLDDRRAVVVGRQMLTRVAAFAKDAGPLPTPVQTAVQAVDSATAALSALLDKGVTIGAVDQEADRAVRGFERLLRAIRETFSGADLLPLEDAAQKRVEAAQTLEKIALPDGTSFLLLAPKLQLLAMERLVAELATKPAVAAIKVLHLETEVARLAAVTNYYAEALGIGVTKLDVNATTLAANQAWHDAFADAGLLARVSFAGEGAATARDAFWSDYEAAVTELRDLDRKGRKLKTRSAGSPE